MISYRLKKLSGSVKDEWESFDPREMGISKNRSSKK